MRPTDTIGEDVWLFHADCLRVLHNLPAVDAVIVDPPYGIGLSTHTDQTCMDGSPRSRSREWNIANDADDELAQFICRWADYQDLPLITFCSPYKPLPGPWRNVLAWDKGPAVGGGGDPATCWKRTFELVCTRRNKPLNGGRDDSVLFFPINTGSDFEFHPCQKPVTLMRYLITKTTEPGDTILDATMGSGTTGVACQQTGRKFIGIESDATHYATALRRLRHASGKSPDQLFAVLD